MENIIYLDMDGVCCDFPGAAIRAHGGDTDEVFAVLERDHIGKSKNYEIMGLPETKFWNAKNHRKEDFWQNIPEYPWFHELYTSLRGIAPVVFLSSAGPCPGALSGQLHWLQNRFGPEFNDYIFTTYKHHLARKGRVLVDDYEVFVEKFQHAGGRAVLFPQMWGRNYHITDRIEFTLRGVKRCMKMC